MKFLIIGKTIINSHYILRQLFFLRIRSLIDVHNDPNINYTEYEFSPWGTGLIVHRPHTSCSPKSS